MRHKRIRLLPVALIFVLTAASAFSTSGEAVDHLDSDVVAGRVSRDEATIVRAVALVKPESLPLRYQDTAIDSDKCATEQVRDAFVAMMNNPELATSYRGILESRPVTQAYYESPLGYFRLHYDSAGVEAVLAADTNGNLIPDYVERGAVLADSIWDYELGELGYMQPPGDGGQGGGENQYDIYFQVLQPYGYTSADLPGPMAWDDYTSFMVVHATFSTALPNDDPEGIVMGALKVTLAHEFFHAIQFGYNAFAESYFMELSSVWMEEEVFPEVNDNYNYLPRFFDYPEEGLKHAGTHSYASFVWAQYLTQNFGRDIMRDLWHHCIYNSPYNSFTYVLDTLGYSFNKEYARFLAWNYLTGSRAGPGHYVDAADYPEVQTMRTHTVVPDSNYFSVEPPEPLASNYVVIENDDGGEGILTFDLDGAAGVAWVAGLVIDYGGGVYFDTIYTTFPNGEGKVYVDHFENVERAIVIPGVASNYGTVYNFFYDVYMRPHGDADGNNFVNIADVTVVIAYIFGSGPGSHPKSAMDADCNGFVNISDAVRIIQYIFGGGPAPCE